MLERDNTEASHAAAEATDALVVALSARLDALVASWELAIIAQRAAGVADRDATRREPADVLAALERELNDVERHYAEHCQVAEAESRAAAEWENRAMAAIGQGRDDVARQALTRQQQYAAAAEAAAGEAAALAAVRDAYRNAAAAVRATVGAADTAV